MHVHSFAFLLLFLPATTICYYLLQPGPPDGRGHPARLWLAAASLIFYASAGPRHLPVLLASVAGNYLLAQAIHAASSDSLRKRLLVLGLCANVGLLCGFKYVDMLLATLEWMPQAWGWTPPGPLRLVLPLGLSFFTLQQIMYLIDVREDLAEPLSPLDHLLFVSFFAHITAGPIARVRQIMPQFDDPGRWRFQWDNASKALTLFGCGLVKKTVLADTLGRLADAGYDQLTAPSLMEAWITSLAFTLQIFFDFSGYVDMAAGAALLFNINLPKNFDRPLAATSLIDFWRRWHITLSNFITTYLYTPLVRSYPPITFTKSLAAILVTMAIAGLWHGAAWTFVAFGLVHGLGLCINHVWRKRKIRLPKAACWLLTLLTVNCGFVFFRAHVFSDAFKILVGMGGGNGLIPGGVSAWQVAMLSPLAFDKIPLFEGMGYLDTALGLIFLVLGLATAATLPESTTLAERLRPCWRKALVLAGALFLGMVFLNSVAEKGFVYRDF